eukprot:scaffold1019_cov97-Skeletonema_marinoi.AAC.21
MHVSQLRGPEVAPAECPDDQISCDISSNADCRSSMDKTSRRCKKTWSKGCCTRDCRPDADGRGRVCRIAPPSEDYFGFFGFADVEDYVGDEDSEEFDSEDLAAENFADSEDDVDFDSEDKDSEDMIFNYYGRMISATALGHQIVRGKSSSASNLVSSSRQPRAEETRGSVEKGELKPGGARAVPEDARARGVCLVRVGRRRWMANALVQARPNCWRKWILGVGAV